MFILPNILYNRPNNITFLCVLHCVAPCLNTQLNAGASLVWLLLSEPMLLLFRSFSVLLRPLAPRFACFIRM